MNLVPRDKIEVIFVACSSHHRFKIIILLKGKTIPLLSVTILLVYDNNSIFKCYRKLLLSAKTIIVSRVSQGTLDFLQLCLPALFLQEDLLVWLKNVG